MSLSFDQACDELDKLMNQIIEHDCQRTNMTNCLLSGGLDSSLICSTAWKQKLQLNAYSLDFKQGSASDAKTLNRLKSQYPEQIKVNTLESAKDLPSAYSRRQNFSIVPNAGLSLYVDNTLQALQ